MSKDVLAIVLLLLPGFVSLLFIQFINGRDSQDKSEIERIIIGLLFNIPTFLLNWGLLVLTNKIFVTVKMASSWDLLTISKFIIKFDSIKFVSYYVLISLISGFIVGNIVIFLGRKDGKFMRVMNWIRKLHQKSDYLGTDVWNKTFGDREELVVEIKTPHETVKGFLRDFSSNGNGEKEITIDYLDTAIKWDDYLQKTKKVYLHIPSGTVVKIFDISEMKQLTEEQNAK
jgi:hypothetical protein